MICDLMASLWWGFKNEEGKLQAHDKWWREKNKN
jgi:hypothetical protein